MSCHTPGNTVTNSTSAAAHSCHSTGHTAGPGTHLVPGARRIALVGNPNAGKSALFYALTGQYVEISNFPGTTLEIFSGHLGDDLLLDTPGVYGISSLNDEERVTRDMVLEADLILNVVDGTHLERDLFLTLQLLDMGLPMVVAVNMMDEVRRQGQRIHLDRLQQALGVPVVGISALHREGIGQVRQALAQAQPGRQDPALERRLKALAARVGQPAALLILEGDVETAARFSVKVEPEQEALYRRRRQRVDELVAQIREEVLDRAGFSARLGRWLVRPWPGIPAALLALGLLYYLIGVLVAQTLVGYSEGWLMQGHYEPAIRWLVGHVFPAGTALNALLVGPYGVLTMTVTYVLGLIFPLVLAFYLALSFLEDSGYLPRLATLVDRAMSALGLNGRAIIPMILGLGCVTMATITTRMLGSKRERTIATALLGLTIPCSAQLAVITTLLVPLGAGVVLLYVAVIAAMFGLIGWVLDRLLPGYSSTLLIDLPPLRWPQASNVWRKTWMRTQMFIREATPLFALGALLISLMQISGALTAVQGWFKPITVGVLHLPAQAATAFIMGIIRRDFGAAGFSNMALSPAQTLVAMVVITLFVPCIAAALTMFKERGWKEACLVWGGSWVVAFLVGGLVAALVL